MKTKILSLLALLCICGWSNAQELTVASYNIRYNNADDIKNGNGWQKRLPHLSRLIQYHDFDIFGSQEGLYDQLQDLKRELPEFDYIGIGRDDGEQAGEHSAIFYKRDKFDLLKSGNFWLSEDTTKPNMGWDAVCIRICTWGEFQEKSSGKKFYFFNLHADHVGIEAQKEGAKLILSKIKEMTNGEPVILTGDFNVDQANESYILLNTSGILKDPYDLSPVKYVNNGTFNAFNLNRKTEARIDHIFLTSHFGVKRYGILTDIYWDNDGTPRIPSDHYPIVVKVDLTK